ncbi:hypothetical protein D3C86_1428180 [compost metagenome]
MREGIQVPAVIISIEASGSTSAFMSSHASWGCLVDLKIENIAQTTVVTGSFRTGMTPTLKLNLDCASPALAHCPSMVIATFLVWRATFVAGIFFDCTGEGDT